MDSITHTPAGTQPSPPSKGPDLAALVASRLCHDLISPLGAISNGIELLMMEGDSLRPEIVLIAESIASATAKIRFLRLALGPAQTGQVLSLAQIQSILSDNFRGSRVKVKWLINHDLERPLVRQAFLGIMCLNQALPLGGTIEVRQLKDFWQVTAEAKRVNIDPTLWSLLTKTQSTHVSEAQHVQFGLLRDSLLATKGLADLTYADDSATLVWRHSA